MAAWVETWAGVSARFAQHHFQLAADNGLDTGSYRLLAEFQRAEQIGPVCHCDGGLFILGSAGDDILDR